MALGFFTVRHFAVRQFAVKKKTLPNLTNLIWPNLTETIIFSYGELSYGEKSEHSFLPAADAWSCGRSRPAGARRWAPGPTIEGAGPVSDVLGAVCSLRCRGGRGWLGRFIKQLFRYISRIYQSYRYSPIISTICGPNNYMGQTNYYPWYLHYQ